MGGYVVLSRTTRNVIFAIVTLFLPMKSILEQDNNSEDVTILGVQLSTYDVSTHRIGFWFYLYLFGVFLRILITTTFSLLY